MVVNKTAIRSFSGMVSQNTYFGIAWTGRLAITTPGTYTFQLASDDGSRLYVDGTVVVDNDGLHPLRTVAGGASLTAGKHAIRVEFIQAAGGATTVLSYQGPDTANLMVVVPASVLDH